MIPIFFGLTAANLLFLVSVFYMGLFVSDLDGAYTSVYSWHVTFAIFAGLFAIMTHVAVYVYFLGTSRWLEAATDKVNLSIDTFVTPAVARKRAAFFTMLLAIVPTMLAMVGGAVADAGVATNTPPLLPDGSHLVLAMAALGANIACSVVEYRLIRQQSMLMDEALVRVNLEQATDT